MQINLNDPNELTLENVREFIRSGDATHTQIRATEEGVAYLSKAVGAQNLEGVRFRFGTFDAGNGYVGEGAANDDDWVNDVYNGLVRVWSSGQRGYIDVY